LGLAAAQADDIAALEAGLAEDGLWVAGSMGQPRLHPAVSELRQARVALARLLGDLPLPNEAQDPETARAHRARRAANARWAATLEGEACRGGFLIRSRTFRRLSVSVLCVSCGVG
jgi:hypothetical protein